MPLPKIKITEELQEQICKIIDDFGVKQQAERMKPFTGGVRGLKRFLEDN